MTRDHIPPEGIFLKPLPTNLITVSCCKSCNKSFSKMDEFFRLFISCRINTSRLGQRVWKERVVASTLPKKRIRKLIDQVKRTIKPIFLKTDTGLILAYSMEIVSQPIELYLIRFVKGLLSYFYPAVDYSSYCFNVTVFDQFRLNNILSGIPTQMIYEERGNKTFEFWRGFATDRPSCGMWILCFFETVSFMVIHDSKQYWQDGEIVFKSSR